MTPADFGLFKWRHQWDKVCNYPMKYSHSYWYLHSFIQMTLLISWLFLERHHGKLLFLVQTEISQQLLNVQLEASLLTFEMAFWQKYFQPQNVYKDGRRVSTSSHCTKVKPKYPRYGRCHLALVTPFETRVCAAVIGGWSHNIEVPPIYLPNSIGNQ